MRRRYNRSMKRQAKGPGRLRWLRAWAIQAAVMLAVGLAASISVGAGRLVYGAMLWLAVPLAGAWTACAAVRGGLWNYAAWVAPPACLFAAHYGLWRFAPPAGPALLCAFVSLVGAATGEVIVQREKTKKR